MNRRGFFGVIVAGMGCFNKPSRTNGTNYVCEEWLAALSMPKPERPHVIACGPNYHDYEVTAEIMTSITDAIY